MKKILITGFSGFVGRHFLDYLYGKGEECEVLGVDINPPKFDLHGYNGVLKIGFRKMNLLDEQAFEDVIAAFCLMRYCIWHPFPVWLTAGNIRRSVSTTTPGFS